MLFLQGDLPTDVWRWLRFYYSQRYGKKIVARVEGITSDGLYDLDVKKSADPQNLSLYIAATRRERSPEKIWFLIFGGFFFSSLWNPNGLNDLKW